MTMVDEAKSDEVLVVKDVARILKVNVPLVYDLINLRLLKAFRLKGGKGDYRITMIALQEFIKRQEDEEATKDH